MRIKKFDRGNKQEKGERTKLKSFYEISVKTIYYSEVFGYTNSKGGDPMIVRPHYLETLKTYRDVPLVKILAGVRRCGKSTILEMLQDDLTKSGVPADHIINMRYTSED